MRPTVHNRERSIHTYRQTDRQTDCHTYSQSHRETDERTGGRTDRTDMEAKLSVLDLGLQAIPRPVLVLETD